MKAVLFLAEDGLEVGRNVTGDDKTGRFQKVPAVGEKGGN